MPKCHLTDMFGTTVTERHFEGTQTGTANAERDLITWQSVDGTLQVCIDGGCGPTEPLDTVFTLGTWTEE